MEGFCYVCSGSSAMALDKLPMLSSSVAALANPLPRFFRAGAATLRLPSVTAHCPIQYQHQSTLCCSNSSSNSRRSSSHGGANKISGGDDGGNSNPSGAKRRRSRQRQTSVVSPSESKNLNVNKGLGQNGDPLGRRDLGKSVVKWLRQGMRAMAADFAAAELRGDFAEVEQRMGPGLTFLIEAQPYLTTIPMPSGLEAACLKACAHYPTLFDHFQRELRDVVHGLQSTSVVDDWRETQSWMLLKKLANSGG